MSDNYWKRYARSKEKSDDSDGWITSYGDMMTLLLVFFVLLFSISTIDPIKMQQVTQQMREALGGKGQKVPTLHEIEKDLAASIENLGIGEVVKVSRDKDGVQLILRGESFFESGKAELRPKVFSFLNEIAWQIHKVPYMVSVEGHTDNVPLRPGGRYPTNWELSGARAASVVRYFETRGVERNRLRIIGWADAKPVNPKIGNSTPKARALNRRVIITFLSEFAPGYLDKSI